MKKILIMMLCLATFSFGTRQLAAQSTVSTFLKNGSSSEYIYNLGGLTVSCSGGESCSNGQVAVSDGEDSWAICGETETTASCSNNTTTGNCGIGCPNNCYCQCSLSTGGTQYVDFTVSGAYIVLSYTLYSDGGSSPVVGADGNPITISVTMQNGGTQPEGSVSNGDIYAYYEISENTVPGSSISLTATDSGFSLTYSAD